MALPRTIDAARDPDWLLTEAYRSCVTGDADDTVADIVDLLGTLAGRLPRSADHVRLVGQITLVRAIDNGYEMRVEDGRGRRVDLVYLGRRNGPKLRIRSYDAGPRDLERMLHKLLVQTIRN